MSLSLAEDIRSVTDLKRHTREIVNQIHQTGRPVILTVNGKADSVIMDAAVYEKHLQAANLGRLLVPAEAEASDGKTRNVADFLNEFTNARTVQG